MISFIRLILITSLLIVQSAYAAQTIDSKSGLLIDKGFKTVKQHCSTCHSLKIVTQNKASRQGWLDTIRWMQKTQGTSSLNAKTEKVILDYLANNYSSSKKSRRAPITIEKWYKYQ